MKLIVGLGNPGKAYADSRHNIGFRVIKALSGNHKAALKRIWGTSSVGCRIKIGRQDVILAEPLTFMNLSGQAVRALVRKFKTDLSSMLVVCDDLDLEAGRIRIRPTGSSGGHRGLQSIIESLDSEGFARLRIGIGRHASFEPAEYVLEPLTKKEKTEFDRIAEKAAECCEHWIEKGINEAMNMFNAKEHK